ncbi:MAG: AMP-binding protein [Pigmentiphaga sp.]
MQPRSIELYEYDFVTVLGQRAADCGERGFLTFEEERYTFADAHRITNQLANGLLAAGVAPGDHVAILLDNSPDIVWYFLALGKIRAVAVPLNTAAKGELLGRFLRQARASWIVTSRTYLDRVADVASLCTDLKSGIVVGARGEQSTRLPFATVRHTECMSASADDPGVEVGFKDLACLMFTSGTTGPSKAIMWTHSSCFAQAAALAQAFGYTRDEVMYTCLPMFHGNALRSMYVALITGCRIALANRFSASGFWEDIRRTGATQFNLLGAMASILWNRPREPDDRVHAASNCMVVPIPSFGKEFARRFGVRLCTTYALTDFAYIAFLGPNEPEDKWDTAGRPQPDIELAILDENDFELPRGETGEICVRNRRPWTTSQGYFDMPQATVEAWRNLWFHTGDRGFLDADGYLHFKDRKKDAIRRRGENISSFEVEQIIAMHPQVHEVAAFAVRSELSEDEVMVSVVRRAGSDLNEEDLVRWAARQMAYFMVPRYVQFLDALPRTLTEKVEKYKLRAAAESNLSRVWDRQAQSIVIGR